MSIYFHQYKVIDGEEGGGGRSRYQEEKGNLILFVEGRFDNLKVISLFSSFNCP